MNQPSTSTAPPARARFLDRIGLNRPELRAWAMYDWAASAVQTTIMVAVFPIFFIKVAGADTAPATATQYYATANSVAIAVVALLSPLLGAIADFRAVKKRMLGLFTGVGVTAVAGMFFIHHGDLHLAWLLFVVVSIMAAGSFVFYESLLPHIAGEAEMDRVSTAGYALGYVGGGVLLALNLAWIMKPGLLGLPSGPGITPAEATLPTRLAFVSVAVWWLCFSLPLFRVVREPPAAPTPEAEGRTVVGGAFLRLAGTFRELRGYKQAFLLLLAFLIYNDGISTIQKMATVYGTELNIDQNALITAILIVQFVGIPFSFLFGALAGKLGTKRAILVGLAVYCGISILGFYMRSARDFFMLAFLVGMVQGGTQGLSRSLFATMIPRQKSGEFFGFFSVFSKFAGIFGPLVFSVIIAHTGSSRPAILSIIAFFLIGGLILLLVDEGEGQRTARAAEAAFDAQAG